MQRILEILCQFFVRDAAPILQPIAHLNNAAQHELYYAELMERDWVARPRDYPWPPGWNG